MAINRRLAHQRKIPIGDQERINTLHTRREALFQVVSAYSFSKPEEVYLKALYDMWIELEEELQDLWKFDKDAKYIKFWNFPYCTCAKLDNEDRYPTGHYYISSNCPIHGGGEK